MKKVLKWIGIVLAALIGLIILAVIIFLVVGNSRINTTYDIKVESVEIPTGEEALEQGKHLAIIRGCTDCHTGNLAGGILIDDPAFGQINPANLTSGQGGIGGTYTDEDWVRSIRHGVGPDGRPLIFMPSHELYFLSDDDLGALIAYLKTVPPVDNQPPEITLGFLARALFGAGQFDELVPAENIDHDSPRPIAPEPGVTAEYGQYMTIGCIGCHGSDFSGGPMPGVPAEAANITPGGDVANWTEQEFIDTLRNGFTPSGKQLNPEYMPWPTFGQMTDDELKAIWLYLQSLPAQETDSGGSSQSAPTPIQASGDVTGQVLFAGTCAVCHGPTGESIEGLGPNLTTSEFVGNVSDEDLLDFIKAGRPVDDPTNTSGVPMPPKGGNQNLTDEQLLDIITYLHSIYKQ